MRENSLYQIYASLCLFKTCRRKFPLFSPCKQNSECAKCSGTKGLQTSNDRATVLKQQFLNKGQQALLGCFWDRQQVQLAGCSSEAVQQGLDVGWSHKILLESLSYILLPLPPLTNESRRELCLTLIDFWFPLLWTPEKQNCWNYKNNHIFRCGESRFSF